MSCTFRLWTITLHVVEIIGGQNFGERQVSSAQTNAMAVVRALQDQELMAQGKDFSLQSGPSSEAHWHGEKQETKRISMVLAEYTPQSRKFNRFNKNGLFGMDRS